MWTGGCRTPGRPALGFPAQHLHGNAQEHHPTGAIGAVVARFVHTEEVTGSNPVSPTEAPQVRGCSGGCARRGQRRGCTNAAEIPSHSGIASAATQLVSGTSVSSESAAPVTQTPVGSWRLATTAAAVSASPGA